VAKGGVKVDAILDDGRRQSGTLAFLENQVDQLTGTVTAKARIANGNEVLWPGQFVKVEVTLGVEPEALSVPAPVIQLGPQGPYLFVVKDGAAELRQVVVKRTQNGESVIGKGLEGGEQVVIDGQLRLVNGAAVSVRPPTAPPAPSAPPATASPPRGAAQTPPRG
jgi:multidrug efflux system membrane fusion protein